MFTIVKALATYIQQHILTARLFLIKRVKMSKCSVSCLCCDQGNLLSDLVVDIVKLGVQKAIAISCRLLPIMIHNNRYYDYIKLVCFLVYYTPT